VTPPTARAGAPTGSNQNLRARTTGTPRLQQATHAASTCCCWSLLLPSIDLLRLRRSAGLWRADGSHGCGLLPTRGAVVGGEEIPWSCCQLRWALVRRLGESMASLWRAWMRLPPTREGRGLWGGRLSLSGGLLPRRCSCCSCSSAPSCVSAWRCPASSPVAHRYRGAVSASRDLSNVPHGTGGAAALCSLGCAAPFDCVDGAVSRFGLLGDALRLRRWHIGVVAPSRPRATFRLYPTTQVVSRRCAVSDAWSLRLRRRCSVMAWFRLANAVRLHWLCLWLCCVVFSLFVSPCNMYCRGVCVVLLYFYSSYATMYFWFT
jgi:hypothetical protein